MGCDIDMKVIELFDCSSQIQQQPEFQLKIYFKWQQRQQNKT